MTVAARLLADRRRAIVWWSAGLVALVLFTVALYPSIEGSADFDELVQELPDSIRVLIGYEAGVPLTSPAGYLHGRLYSTLLPLLVLVFAIGGGARAIGGSEEDGTLEPLLANPVSRARVYVERYVATTALLLALGVVFLVSLAVLARPFGATDGIAAGRLVAATVAAIALALLHGTVAYAVGAATGRRGTAIGVAAALAVGGYLYQTLMTLTGAPSWLLWLTPWQWYLDQNMLADGAAVAAIYVPLLVTVPVFAAGWWAFTHRDLR